MSPSRVAELRALGVSMDPHGDRRASGLGELGRYLRAHSERHKPPAAWVTPDGFKLGQWVTNRLCEAKAGTLHPDVDRGFRAHGLLP